MEKVFIILSNQSDYDSQNEILGFCTTEEEAKSTTETLKQSYRKARDFRDKVLRPAESEFNDSNPTNYKSQIPLDKWPSGIGEAQITKEMRDRREETKRQNQLILEENSVNEKLRMEKRVKHLLPLVEPVKNENWFKNWFEVGELFINCHASGLCENHEYIYEECANLKEILKDKI